MHVSVPGTNSEVSDAKAQSLTYVVLLATTAAISGFLFGFDTAVINGVLLFLRRQFVLSNLQTEIAASSLLLGCLLGAAAASMIGDRYGRKKSPPTRSSRSPARPPRLILGPAPRELRCMQTRLRICLLMAVT